MTSGTEYPWTILGIGPTDDAAAIRRAYARQLKAQRPDVDPDAFHRLRAARAKALAQASALGDPLWTEQPLREIQRAMPSHLDEADDGPSGKAWDEGAGGLFDLGEASHIAETELLFETERHRIAAARLRPEIGAFLDRIETGASIDASAFARLLQHAAMLPRGPRHDIETTCVAALTRGWRKSDGSLDPTRVGAAMPLLRVADDAFGWGGDDEAVTATLSAQDADALNLVLDAAEYRSRSPRLPAVMRMRPADALAYVAESGRYRSLFETAVARRATPWRLNVAAFLAPHLWAYHSRLWRELLVLYVVVAMPSLILVLWNGRPTTLVVAVLGLAFLSVCVGSALLADRLVFAAALRAVGRADRMALFDKTGRETYLSKKAKLPTFVFAIYLFYPICFPYWVIYELYMRFVS